MSEMQVHERLRRRLSSASLLEGQRLRQPVGLLRRSLCNVREHAECAGAAPLCQKARRRADWHARRADEWVVSLSGLWTLSDCSNDSPRPATTKIRVRPNVGDRDAKLSAHSPA